VTTGATLFSGGGCVEAGLRDLVDFRWAVEVDPAIAGVYRANIGDHVIVADVSAVDYDALPAVDYLHASPVCKNASRAKVGGAEAPEDRLMATAVCRALRAVQPRVFTLENVVGYQRFESFAMIGRTLNELGYIWHAASYNSADAGVPQTRRRLILRAVKDALLPPPPPPLPWVGWYAAIEDLIPTLPESRFADWQLKTLVATVHGKAAVPRAFIIGGQYQTPNGEDRVPQHRAGDRPIWTITGSEHGDTRAWLSEGRVVAMTPRALARFQSIPDWYVLPEKKALACMVIGNGWPSLMARRLVESML
jgi:DNA (cytosine-5)-methyltransferase 1